MRTVLHVGCGPKSIDQLTHGFRDGSWREVRLDIDPDVRPDIVGTITDMSSVESESVDAVFSSHNIEHVYTHEVPAVLAEFKRVLKPDGFAVVTCPDLEGVAEHIAAGRLDEPLYMSPAGPITPLDVLYGHGPAIAAGRTFMAHRTGFSIKSMQRVTAASGFASFGLLRLKTVFELWVVASKIEQNQEEMRAMVDRYARYKPMEASPQPAA